MEISMEFSWKISVKFMKNLEFIWNFHGISMKFSEKFHKNMEKNHFGLLWKKLKNIYGISMENLKIFPSPFHTNFWKK
jgi:hypothetical protein